MAAGPAVTWIRPRVGHHTVAPTRAEASRPRRGVLLGTPETSVSILINVIKLQQPDQYQSEAREAATVECGLAGFVHYVETDT